MRIFSGDAPHVAGDAFADFAGEHADDRPDRLLEIVRNEGQIKANQFMVGSRELESLLARTDLGGNAVQFVVENVAETLGEDERKNVVLVFRRILCATDGTCRISYPGFEGFSIAVLVSHQRFVLCFPGNNNAWRASI